MFKTFFDNLKYRREKNIGGTIKRFVVNNIIYHILKLLLFFIESYHFSIYNLRDDFCQLTA